MKISELQLANKELSSTVMELFYQARRDLLTYHPFCGMIALNFQGVITCDERMKNSCTDGENIYLDSGFFSRATKEHRMVIIAHNVWHCALHHFTRRQKNPGQNFDYAADLEVDLILHKDGFNFTLLPHDENWHNLSVEQVCEKLPKYITRKIYWDTHILIETPIPENLFTLEDDGSKKEQDKNKNHQNKDNLDSNNANSNNANSNNNESLDKPPKESQLEDEKIEDKATTDNDNSYLAKNKPNDGRKDEPNCQGSQLKEHQNTNNYSTKEFDTYNGILEFDGIIKTPIWKINQFDKMVYSCASLCQGRGTLPNYMSKALKLKEKKTLSWQELLREYITMRINSSLSWTCPNKRYIHRSLYLPGKIKTPDIKMAVAIDTSGSTEPFVEDFLAELHAIFSSFTNYEITLIQCDCHIQKVDVYSTSEGKLFPKAEELNNFNFSGFGGTDLCPPFEYIQNNMFSEIQCLIYFTDGFGPAPNDAPDYPVLWVLTPGGVQPANFGEEVYIQ